MGAKWPFYSVEIMAKGNPRSEIGEERKKNQERFKEYVIGAQSKSESTKTKMTSHVFCGIVANVKISMAIIKKEENHLTETDFFS